MNSLSTLNEVADDFKLPEDQVTISQGSFLPPAFHRDGFTLLPDLLFFIITDITPALESS